MLPGFVAQARHRIVNHLGRLQKFCEVGTALRCLACGRVIFSPENGLQCCPECSAELRPRLKGYCPGCGAIFAREEEEPCLCLACRSQRKPWVRFGFFQVYKGLLRDLIMAYKYEAALGYNKVLQGLLLQTYLTRFAAQHGRDGQDLLLPVPMHVHRLQARGFNHSLELARVLISQGLELRAEAMQRVQSTKPQAGLDRKQRWKNLQGAFQVDRELVKGRSILLVDDVYTTGATATICSKELIKAGAKEVNLLVLARAETI